MKQLITQFSFFFISSMINCIIGQQIPVLNLSEAINHPVNITSRDFVGSISYIQLATSPVCLIDANPIIHITEKFVIIINQKKCLLFDRSSGKFIKEIGHYGRDPGGYRSAFGFFNELASAYYFIGWDDNFMKYSLDGVFRGKVKIPGYIDSFDTPSIPDVYSYINDKIFVCNFMIIYGTEKNLIQIYNENGRIIKIIPNRNVLTKHPYALTTKEILFHRYNNNLFFQSMYNDTVFKLTEKQIIPAFILNRGRYLPPFESRWWPNEKKQKSHFISQSEYFEDARFISFNLYLDKVRYFALYDKSMKSLKVTENISGIKNNFDGFIDLTFNSINEAGELSGLIQPDKLLEWIKLNPDKFKSLKPELQKFKDIKMEDNPIVAIAKYKR